MRQANGHAVVLGAGMGGLLAARALADHFGRVTVVERDELPAAPRDRRGVPQGRHLHGLLARGVQSLDALFPGLVDELVADGAPQARFLAAALLVLSGHQLARGDAGVSAVQATRPMLERTVRSRVAGLPNVTLVDGAEVAGLEARDGRVAGARIVRRGTADAEEVLEADLVVDAMGRAGRTRAWLAELGYDPPVEERVKCDLSYVSRFLRLPEGALAGDRVVVVGPVPGRPRAMGLGLQEGDRWLLTLGGMAGDHPPHDDQGFLAFARTVAPAEVYVAISRAEPLSDLTTHRFPASVRRRYERLRRFPAGLLVFGDAICSFNPIYGQGMSVAAVEAEALRRCLEAGDHDLAGRFFRAAAKAVDPAWRLAAGGDLTLPEVPGHRRPSTRVVNRYVRRLHRVAAYDAKVAAAFVRVAGLVDPPSAIMTPAVAGRVLLGRRRRP
jgi:2-polyprenyl-6-methoxyphenol hydroxylase-like FAD-dependent oxidoreductase